MANQACLFSVGFVCLATHRTFETESLRRPFDFKSQPTDRVNTNANRNDVGCRRQKGRYWLSKLLSPISKRSNYHTPFCGSNNIRLYPARTASTSAKATLGCHRSVQTNCNAHKSRLPISLFLPLLLPTGQPGIQQIIERIIGLLVLLLLGYHLGSSRRCLGGCLLGFLLGGSLGRNLGRKRRLVVGVARFLGPLLLCCRVVGMSIEFQNHAVAP